MRQGCEKKTPSRDKGELYYSQSDRFRKGVENGLGGSIGQSRAQVPDKAEHLKYLLAGAYFSATGSPTKILYDTGAFNASAISCAFSLTLAFLIRMFLKASLMLLCRPCCLGPATLRWPSPQAKWLSFRVCHLSLCNTPFVFAGLNVLADPFLTLSLSS